MDAKLVVITGKTSKRLVQLQLPAVLGRSREADITVAHPMISRRHCEIFEHDGLLMLRDMASLNGTMIGGHKITLAPLLPQSEFSIGPISFRVLYEFNGDLASLPNTQYAAADPGFPMPSAEAARSDFEFSPEAVEEAQTGPSINDSIQMPGPDLDAWADAEDHPPPMPTAPPSAVQIAARQAQRSQEQSPKQQNTPPANVHPLRNLSVPPNSVPHLSVPRDKLPTIPLPEALPANEGETAEPKTPTTSPWDDGDSPPAAHPQPKPAEDDFGSFLEGLQ